MITALVRILEVDPALAEGLDEQARALANERALAPVETLAPGDWHSQLADRADPFDIGLLVLEGVICRRIDVADASFIELLGAGDIVCPWRRESGRATVESREHWTLLTRTSVALLDRRFAVSTARWPEITAHLIDRCASRWHSLALSGAVSHLIRVELRLMAALWQLADRWGRVTPEGIVIPLRLTSTMLASIVGARRPSVSTATNTLARRNLLRRCEDGTWLLLGTPPGSLADLRQSWEAADDAKPRYGLKVPATG
jgi:CRP/FNR family transcriptional regulator, cyclic AMP receptor protein